MASSALEALRAQSSSYSKLLDDVAKLTVTDSKVKSYNDERLWKLSMDEACNGSAIIRFLPPPAGEDSNWVNIFKFNFSYINGKINFTNKPVKGAKYYIENSPTTLGLPDYCYEQNKVLYDTGTESNIEIAKKRKRTTNYHCNILVVKDPVHPENDGKVFLFKFGTKIMEKIIARMKDQEPDLLEEDSEGIKGINPFCFWTGADFTLKISKIDGWPSYVNSSFRKPKPVFGGDDEAIENIWKQTYSLKELIDPKHFKTYDELKKRFLEVTSSASIGNAAGETDIVKFVDEDDDVPVFSATEVKKKQVVQSLVEDDDEDLSFFEKLSKEE